MSNHNIVDYTVSDLKIELAKIKKTGLAKRTDAQKDRIAEIEAIIKALSSQVTDDAPIEATPDNTAVEPVQDAPLDTKEPEAVSAEPETPVEEPVASEPATDAVPDNTAVEPLAEAVGGGEKKKRVRRKFRVITEGMTEEEKEEILAERRARQSIANRNHYEKHKEFLLQKNKNYYAANKDKFKEYAKNRKAKLQGNSDSEQSV